MHARTHIFSARARRFACARVQEWSPRMCSPLPLFPSLSGAFHACACVEDARIAMEIYSKCKDEWERSVAAFTTSAATRIRKKRKRP